MSNKTNAAILIAAGAVFAAVVLTVTAVASASRNSSGTMSPANGPYVAGTVINPTTINSRYSDIENEITDSLSRSGKGGMTAPLREADGTNAAPAFSFTSETGTGMYRIGAGDLGWAITGTKKLELTSALFTVTPALRTTGVAAFNGVVSTPSAGTTSHAPSNASFAQLTNLVANHAFAVESNHTNGNYIPGLIWFTSDDNATIPKAGIFLQDTVSGSVLQLGTSNAYATGITASTTIDWTGKLTAPGGVVVGASGTAISGSFAASSGWTPGSIGAGSSAGTAITVTGAAAGSPCMIGSPAPNTGVYLWCYVTLNSCNIQLVNPTAAPITGSAGTYQCRVFNP